MPNDMIKMLLGIFISLLIDYDFVRLMKCNSICTLITLL